MVYKINVVIIHIDKDDEFISWSDIRNLAELINRQQDLDIDIMQKFQKADLYYFIYIEIMMVF